MLSTEEFKKLQLKFVVVIISIMSLSYAIFISSINIFQQYTVSQHLDLLIYNHDTIVSARIVMLIMAFNCFKKLQNPHHQRLLLSILILLLLMLPVHLKTYSMLAGFSSAAVELSKAWFQLYVPPALRATLSGILTALSGLIKIRSTAMETHWAQAVFHKYIITSILTACLFFFWKYSIKLEMKNNSWQSSAVTSENIIQLVVKNPYIFLAALIAGFNSGLFYYTLLIGKAALPHASAQLYQYIIYSGGVICPIIIGYAADKYGIAFINISVVLMLTICKFSEASLAFTHIKTPIYYYCLAFIGSGLAASLWTLSASLIGEKLLEKGVFRSFAISAIIINFGALIYERIYNLFFYSFMLTKFSIGIANSLFLLLLYFFYKRSFDKKT